MTYFREGAAQIVRLRRQNDHRHQPSEGIGSGIADRYKPTCPHSGIPAASAGTMDPLSRFNSSSADITTRNTANDYLFPSTPVLPLVVQRWSSCRPRRAVIVVVLSSSCRAAASCLHHKSSTPTPNPTFHRSSTMLVRFVVPPSSFHVVVVMYTRRRHVAAVSTQQKLCVGLWV